MARARGWRGFKPNECHRYSIAETLVLIEKGRDFCAFDLEHSGTETQDIVEIGAIRFNGQSGEVEEIFDEVIYLNPKLFSHYAKRRTGIQHQELRSGQPRAETLARFREFVEGAVPVLHAALDDMLTVNRNLRRHELKVIPRQAIDIQVWARNDFECTAISLSALCERFGVTAEPTHRALADARATLEVFRAMLAQRR